MKNYLPMNAIVSFRKCTLTDEELLQKVDEQTDNIFDSQKVPTRNVPARPNDDYDLLIGELILRYKELSGRLIDCEKAMGDIQ